MTFVPSAAGAYRDLREGTDLARNSAFFGSSAEAARFFRIGVAPLLPTLPRRVRGVDFGGGQGVLALVVRDALREAGFDARMAVVDANERYLADARALGLETVLANIQEYADSGVDLALMRLVTHYNDEAQQTAMLSAVRRSLRPGAPFVSQIETGSSVVCTLHSAIAQLLARDGGGPAGYAWATLDRYVAQLEASGFGDVAIVGGTPDTERSIERTLADAWQRFSGSSRPPEEAPEGGAPAAPALVEARALVRAALADPHGQGDRDLARGIVRLSYPILVCRRPEAG